MHVVTRAVAFACMTVYMYTRYVCFRDISCKTFVST